MKDINPDIGYFVRKTCSPAWELEPTFIPFCDLTFVLKGSAVYYSESSAQIVEAGQAIFIPQGGFRCATTKGMECAAFNFKCDNIPALFESAARLNVNGDERLLQYLGEFERDWMGLDEWKTLKCKGLFLLILHRLLELSRLVAGSPHVARIRAYLEEHYRERVTVHSVSAYIGLHPAYCGALFRKEMGCGILHYLNQLRVNRALALLQFGGIRVTDVAMETGFADLYYFSRVFKAFTGRSPEQFLKEKGL